MNYRHAYHAGNPADCLKHALLVWLLGALRRKPAPFTVLDTHAGIGWYDLSSPEATATGEWRDGIGRLRDNPPPALLEYLSLVPEDGSYPGSPAIARALLRPQDRLVCCELHPDDAGVLRRRYLHDPQVAIHRRDGYEALGALLPPPTPRGLVLIDPPYETQDDPDRVAAGLCTAHARYRPGVLAAWYPIKHLAPVRALHRAVSGRLRDVVAAGFWQRPPLDPQRLNGSGLIVVNPPFGFEAAAAVILAALSDRLGEPAAASPWSAWLMNDVLVLGGGAWGTALAVQADRAGARTVLWLRDAGRAAHLNATRINPHLPGVRLPPSIQVTAVLDTPARLRLLVVPAQQLRSLGAMLPPGGKLVVCAKGIESGTGRLPLDVLAEVCPGLPAAVLSGPNFAHEIAAGLPAASVIASTDAALRDQATELLGTAAFRLYGNDDPIGVQIGGAAKNVVAIAAGAVIGAGLGENARAALVTRGLAELARLSTALGGRAETVAGLSGMGDLLLTCTGPASRNYSLGHALGRGETLEHALTQASGVAEGVTTAPAMRERAQLLGLELPICAAVADLIGGRADLAQAIAALLARPRRQE